MDKAIVNSPLRAFVVDSFPADEINDTLKLILHANGHLNCSGGNSKLGADLVNHAPRVRARSERWHSQKKFEVS